ncbi:MAG: alkaline phosphatase family protein [Planctomycetota bacterium]
MRPVLVLDIPGLSPDRIGEHTPNLRRLAEDGFQAVLEPVLPAVTCPVQATILTGRLPREHGIVGNGWYFRDLAEIWFWRQSNHLVSGEKVWEKGRRRDARFTCAKLFWWYAMYASADWSVTPRPIYPADGRKIPGIYAQPPELEEILDRALGTFPLFEFWGPRAGIRSSEWIAGAARVVLERFRPTLTLVYLPHLDYDFQRRGPRFPGAEAELRAVDRVAGSLIDTARDLGAEAVALSEYAIVPVSGSVSVNRFLRRQGLLAVRERLGRELLDAGASRAFAVADHQVAHAYVRREEDIPPVRRALESLEGVDLVLDREGQAAFGLDHPRSGELVLVAKPDRWFDYYYWLDERKAPDFAPTVDIHRKPGYDPAELFFDDSRRFPRLRAARKLLASRLGFRTLFDVVPTSAERVRGSHGRLPSSPGEGPVLVSSSRRQAASRLAATEVADLLLDTVFSA